MAGQTDKTDVNVRLSAEIKQNIDRVRADFGSSSDLVINENTFGKTTGKTANTVAAVYLNGMADEKTINSISKEIAVIQDDPQRNRPVPGFEYLLSTISRVRATSVGEDFTAMYKEILAGNTVFLVNGSDRYFSVSTSSSEGRAISEPTSQTIIKGPKDAFTEDIDTNISLIRKRIRNEALRIEDITLGSVSHTKIKMLYMNAIAKGDIVADVRSRLAAVVNDGIFDSGYVEEFIKTDKYSIFPTSLTTRKGRIPSRRRCWKAKSPSSWTGRPT